MGIFKKNSNKIIIGSGTDNDDKKTYGGSSLTWEEIKQNEEDILKEYLTTVDDGSGNYNIQHRSQEYTTLFYGDVLWVLRVKWTPSARWAKFATLEGDKQINLHSVNDIFAYSDKTKEYVTFIMEAERKRQEKKRKQAEKNK